MAATSLEKVWVRMWHGGRLVAWTHDACAAALWMACALSLRAMMHAMCILPYIPEGLIFGLPVFFHQVTRLAKFEFLYLQHFPHVALRLAESVMGRFPKRKLVGIVTAQLAGTLFGVVLFYTLYSGVFGDGKARSMLLPVKASAYGSNSHNHIYSPEHAWFTHPHSGAAGGGEADACVGQDGRALPAGAGGSGYDANGSSAGGGDCIAAPLTGSGVSSAQYYAVNDTMEGGDTLLSNIVLDSVLACVYCLLLLVLPEMLHLNNLPWRYLYIPLAVLLVAHSLMVSQTSLSSVMNPATGAVLWYLHVGAGADGAIDAASAAGGATGATSAGLSLQAMSLTSVLEELGVSATATLHPLIVDLGGLLPIRALFTACSTVARYTLNTTIFTEHWFGAIIGGLLAGFISRRLVPDDNSSWRRRS